MTKHKSAVAEPGSNGTAAQIEQVVVVAEMDLREIDLKIIGTSSLISNRWSDKAKKQMRDKQTKQPSIGRAAKDAKQDYKDSLYEHPAGGYGFPSIAFKAAAVRGGTYTDDKMTFLRGAFHVLGELVKIEGKPTMREDMVRLQKTTADIRYRGEFKEWRCTLTIRYNARAISVAQLVNLFRVAGFSVGVGEWRPEKNGSHGMFEVAKQGA